MDNTAPGLNRGEMEALAGELWQRMRHLGDFGEHLKPAALYSDAEADQPIFREALAEGCHLRAIASVERPECCSDTSLQPSSSRIGA